MPWKYHHGMPFCVLTTAVSGPKSGCSVRRQRGQAVRLDAEEDDVGLADRRQIAGRRSACTSKSPSGLMTRSPRSCIARRCGPRANSTTSAPGLRQLRADVAADRAGAGDQTIAHRRAPASTPWRRRRAGSCRSRCAESPAVMWICFGRLKSASRSLQNASSSASLTDSPSRSTTAASTSSPHVRVRHAEADRFGDRRMRQQHFVDLARRDLLAAAVDQLLDAADQRQVAVRRRGSPGRRCGTSRR